MDLKMRLDAEQLSAAEALEDAMRLRKQLDHSMTRIADLEQEVAKERANFHEEELRRANETTKFASEAESLTTENAHLRDQVKEKGNLLRDLRAEIHDVRGELDAVLHRVDDLSNQKSDNTRLDAALKDQLSIESKRKETSTPVPVPEMSVVEQVARPFIDVPSSAVQSELEALSAKHTQALNRIASLEVESARVGGLQNHIQDLNKQLEEIRAAYDCLLEVDGERLERIEELQHDVFDLRELLKQQMLVFGATMEERKASES